MSTPAATSTKSIRRRSRRTVKAQSNSVEAPLEPTSIVTHDSAFIEPHARISEAAYYLAERRGFDPGHEIEDWLTAEREIERAQAVGETPHLCGD